MEFKRIICWCKTAELHCLHVCRS